MRVFCPKSGRAMDLFTNAPGLQFYSGNYLDGSLEGKGGVRYPKHGGFALETQVPHLPSLSGPMPLASRVCQSSYVRASAMR